MEIYQSDPRVTPPSGLSFVKDANGFETLPCCVSSSSLRLDRRVRRLMPCVQRPIRTTKRLNLVHRYLHDDRQGPYSSSRFSGRLPHHRTPTRKHRHHSNESFRFFGL